MMDFPLLLGICQEGSMAFYYVLLFSLFYLVYSVNDAVLMSLCPTDIHMTRCRGHLASIYFYLFLYDEESTSWDGISKHCLLFLESSILFQRSL